MFKQRSFTTYMFLNALTLGIYGLVVKSQIGNEINTFCNGDGEQPRFGFIAAWLLNKIGSNGVYLPSWWYTQTKRLYANSVRYGMTVRETPMQHYAWMYFVSMFSKVLYFPFLFAVIAVAGSLVGLGSIGMGFAGGIFYEISDFVADAFRYLEGFAIVFVFLGTYLVGFTLSLLSSFDMFNVIKDVNRYAEAAMAVNPNPYDPMVIPEVDNKKNIFNRAVEIVDTVSVDTIFAGIGGTSTPVVDNRQIRHLEDDMRRLQSEITRLQSKIINGGGGKANSGVVPTPPRPEQFSKILCKSGSAKGSLFNVSSEKEFIIGKDSSCQCVIASTYKSVSRKHCGLRYDNKNDRYFITDYSTNGTFVNGKKLPQNSTVAIKKGVTVKLGDTENEFLLQ